MDVEMIPAEAYKLIQEIRHVDRKFRRARKQILLLNERIRALLVHYERAGRDDRKAIRYSRRLQVATVEGVRNMFYEYARRQCEVMDELQDILKSLTGSEYEDFEDFD